MCTKREGALFKMNCEELIQEMEISSGDAELVDSNQHPSAIDANQNYAWASHVSCTGDKYKYKWKYK